MCIIQTQLCCNANCDEVGKRKLMLAKVAIIEDSIPLYCKTYVHFKVGHMATLTQKNW